MSYAGKAPLKTRRRLSLVLSAVSFADVSSKPVVYFEPKISYMLIGIAGVGNEREPSFCRIILCSSGPLLIADRIRPSGAIEQ
jgi:hypothetical protein